MKTLAHVFLFRSRVAFSGLALLCLASCKRPAEHPPTPSHESASAPTANATSLPPARPRAALPPAPPRPVRAPVEEPVPLPDETVAKLLVETGANRLAYRGWPLRIRFLDPEGKPAPGDVLVLLDARGAEVARFTAIKPGLWWLTATETARLPAGKCTLRLGPAQAGVTMAAAPIALSPEQDGERRFAIVLHASEIGDNAAARREAEAWATAAPRDPRPQAALGDALAEAGDHAGAYKAYRAAIDRLPGKHPNLELERKAGLMLARQLDTLPAYSGGSAPPRSPLAANAPDPSVLPAASANPADSQPAAPSAATASRQAPGTIQWAASARASSEYRTPDWGAVQATGAPDSTRYGDSRKSWATRNADSGEEWIELTYSRPMRATGVRVLQNFNPGTLMKIELIAEDGSSSTVWTGPDATVYERNRVGSFETTFPRTDKVIVRVKLTLDTKRMSGWNEIDAVALIATAE